MIKNDIPKFPHEDEERDFWATHDSSEFIDWRQAKRLTCKNLKSSGQLPIPRCFDK